MHTPASFPVYLPGTDLKIADAEVRIRAAGDDRRYWDVEVLGSDDRYHAVSGDVAKAILAHVEKNDVGAFEDILAAA